MVQSSERKKARLVDLTETFSRNRFEKGRHEAGCYGQTRW